MSKRTLIVTMILGGVAACGGSPRSGAGKTVAGDIVPMNTATSTVPITTGEHAQMGAGATRTGCTVQTTEPAAGSDRTYVSAVTCTTSGQRVRYVFTHPGVEGQQAVSCEVPKGRADLCDAGVLMKWFEAGAQ